MDKRIVISEEEIKDIKSLYEDFTGIKDGKIEYVTSSGKKSSCNNNKFYT